MEAVAGVLCMNLWNGWENLKEKPLKIATRNYIDSFLSASKKNDNCCMETSIYNR